MEFKLKFHYIYSHFSQHFPCWLKSFIVKSANCELSATADCVACHIPCVASTTWSLTYRECGVCHCVGRWGSSGQGVVRSRGRSYIFYPKCATQKPSAFFTCQIRKLTLQKRKWQGEMRKGERDRERRRKAGLWEIWTRPHFEILQIVSHWQSVGHCNQRMLQRFSFMPCMWWELKLLRYGAIKGGVAAIECNLPNWFLLLWYQIKKCESWHLVNHLKRSLLS